MDRPPTAPELVVVRHGQTAWSRDGRHTGRTDVPLTPEGLRQARQVGRLLADRPLRAVLSSPLSRARQTCEAAGLADRVELVADLAEWDYGAFEGLTTPEILAAHPGWSLWSDGAPEGEHPADVGRRADRVLEQARAVGHATGERGQDAEQEGAVVLVGHGHQLRVLAARFLGLPPAAGRLLALSEGSVSILGFEHATPVVWGWNRQETLPPA